MITAKEYAEHLLGEKLPDEETGYSGCGHIASKSDLTCTKLIGSTIFERDQKSGLPVVRPSPDICSSE